MFTAEEEHRQRAVEQQRQADEATSRTCAEVKLRRGPGGAAKAVRGWEAAKSQAQEEAALGRAEEEAEPSSAQLRVSIIADEDENSVLVFVPPSQKQETAATATATAASIPTKPTVSRQPRNRWSTCDLPVVYYGHAGPWALTVMSSVLAAGCTSIVWTGDCGAYMQRLVGTGFINVDGHGDLFVAVSMSDSLTGRAYVVESLAMPPTRGPSPVQQNENLLHTICVGDSNSDGLNDLVVLSLLGCDVWLTVRLGRTFTSTARVGHGRRSPCHSRASTARETAVPRHARPAGFKVYSKFFKEFFGHTISGVGDANSYDLAGLAVSSLAWSVSSTSSGAVFVLFGSHGMQFPWGIADLHVGAGAVIQGDPKCFARMLLGWASDVNSGGFDDLLIGSQSNDCGGHTHHAGTFTREPALSSRMSPKCFTGM
eukprot:m51a1_g1449 hypothetical protein (427) ;mRNA; f:167646-170337